MNSVGVEVFSNDEMYSVYALSWQVPGEEEHCILANIAASAHILFAYIA